MAFVLPDPDPEPAPLMPELHASSSPPAPMTAAPAPTARSTPRRLTLPSEPGSPDCTLWSLICHRSPREVVSQEASTPALPYTKILGPDDRRSGQRVALGISIASVRLAHGHAQYDYPHCRSFVFITDAACRPRSASRRGQTCGANGPMLPFISALRVRASGTPPV